MYLLSTFCVVAKLDCIAYDPPIFTNINLVNAKLVFVRIQEMIVEFRKTLLDQIKSLSVDRNVLHTLPTVYHENQSCETIMFNLENSCFIMLFLILHV